MKPLRQPPTRAAKRLFRRRLVASGAALATAAVLTGCVSAAVPARAHGAERASGWSEPVRLTPPGGGVRSGNLARSNDTLYFAYLSGGSVYFRRSTDAGASWGTPIAIASGDEFPLTEPLAAEGPNVYVVYDRSRVLYFRRSTDRGTTWSSERALYTGTPNGFYRLSMAVRGRALQLVWSEANRSTFLATSGLLYRRSLDGGETWGRAVTLVRQADQPERPSLSVDGKTVHLAWMDERDLNPHCYVFPHCPEVYYRRSTDSGTHWRPARRMTTGSRIARPDVLARAGGAVSLVWQNSGASDGQEEMYSNYSADGGVTWAGARRLTFAGNESEHGATSTNGPSVLLAWMDRRSGTYQEYARLSSTGGASWGPEEQVTDDGQQNRAPAVAVTSRYAHMVWPVNDDYVEYSRRPLAPNLQSR